MSEKTFAMYKFIVKHLSTNAKRRLRQIKFLDKLNIILRRKYKPDFIITKDKHKIFLDANNSLHLSVHPTWEELETKTIKRYVKEGDIVVDVGANIGYYTLLLAKLVGAKGKVYAFEPEPNNFALLKKNIDVNGYKNIIAIQKAVSDKNGKIKLYIEEDYTAGNKIYNPNGNLNSIEIESVTLDNFFKNKKHKINFIKMDIEGAEGKAIKGMRRLIKENNDIKIIFEFYPKGYKECGTGPEEFFDMLKKLKLGFYNINEQTNKIENVTDRRLIEELNGDGFTNLLCMKNDGEQYLSMLK